MRYLMVSVSIHALLVSFIWVGFSVSRGQEQNSFTYLGEMTGSQSAARATAKDVRNVDVSMFEDASAAFFGPWLKMRELNKPR